MRLGVVRTANSESVHSAFACPVNTAPARQTFLLIRRILTVSDSATIEQHLLPYEWPGSYFIGEEEIDSVTKVLLSRSLFRFYGHDPQHCVDRAEEFYRNRLGRRHALAVSSGTTALSIAIAAADIGPGDEV